MKKWIVFVYAAIVASFLFGCSYFEEEDNTELTQEEITSSGHTTVESVSGGSVSGTKTLLIYTIDGGRRLAPLKVPITSANITPGLTVDKVLENIDEQIVVTEIEVVKKRIYIYFSDEYAPIQKCSKKFETLILDCISNSLLDNIPYVDEVVFRSEKGAYHSENFTFEMDEVYSSK